MSVVIIENQQVIVTIPLLNELADNNVAVIFCDSHFMPSIQLVPLERNETQQESYKYQMNASQPLVKRIWKEIIEAKIKNQALLLESLSKDATAYVLVVSVKDSIFASGKKQSRRSRTLGFTLRP
ncbi:MAG: CRISPR-associated endonuclease Cas1 [Paludibacteraceae bacterium]|nr:CRISPR-associated endonuclease Cas1 [Paludibacteraceae bacterium]